MRYFATLSLLGILGVLALAMQPSVSETLPSAPLNVGDNAGWLKFIAAREKTLTRVTDKPQSMDARVVRFCRGPLPKELPENNPHLGHSVHVYVTPGEEKKIRTGEGTYPVGTLIVKEKLSTKPVEQIDLYPNSGKPTPQPRQDPDLFTVMLKREAGYNKECGDWEFMVVSGDVKQIVARGKIDSCVECHKDHKATDFVTQLYPLPNK
jgi:Cytochrome P460